MVTVLMSWIILCIVIGFPIFSAISGKRLAASNLENKKSYYIRSLIADFIIMLVLLALVFYVASTFAVDFYNGISVPQFFWDIAIFLFLFPFVFSFTTLDKHYFKLTDDDTELMGFPNHLLPDNLRQLLIFTAYIIVGVFIEEILCRFLAFHALKMTIGIDGDWLVIITAIFFSVGHWYQGWKGLLMTFVYGIILGKIFLLTQNLFYTIMLHLALNLSLCVLVFKKVNKRNQNSMEKN